jgi:hypothetical protein
VGRHARDDRFLRELAAAVGLGGRDREAHRRAKRRLAVTGASATLANIRAHRGVGQHLDASIRTAAPRMCRPRVTGVGDRDASREHHRKRLLPRVRPE